MTEQSEISSHIISVPALVFVNANDPLLIPSGFSVKL
jgi:hypothetical protein